MNISTKVISRKGAPSSVVALHCSLGSGRQWARLGAGLGTRLIAPDLIGYGASLCPLDLPSTLGEEVQALSARLCEIEGPMHLVGHSYGGAIAFKIATSHAFRDRVRSLSLIEPVLPTLLLDSEPDRRLYHQFAVLAREVSNHIWDGAMMEAIDRFTDFWAGSGPREPLSDTARIRMIERARRLPFDFMSAFAEKNVATAAASLRVPTLLFSGGHSPNLTQRIVRRLDALIEGSKWRHLVDAGHMLAMSHAPIINPAIAAHISRADELAGVPLAAEAPDAGVLRFVRG